MHHGKQRGQLATPKSHHPPERGKRWIDYHSWGIWELIKIFYHNQPRWWDKLQSSDQLHPPRCKSHIKKKTTTLKTYSSAQQVGLSISPSAAHPLKCLITLDMDSRLPKPRECKADGVVVTGREHLAFERQAHPESGVTGVKHSIIHLLLLLGWGCFVCSPGGRRKVEVERRSHVPWNRL